MARVNTCVYVVHPDTGVHHVLNAGDEVPEWASVTNSAVLVDGDEPTGEVTETETETETETPETSEDEDSEPEVVEVDDPETAEGENEPEPEPAPAPAKRSRRSARKA